MQQRTVILGLRENLNQFILLVIINAFVGGMVGMERSILPKIADADFHIAAKTIILSFIIVFSIAKAITNYFAGTWANKIGRKNLLVIGWLIGMPVPFMLMWGPGWNWIVAANVLLGINQGLTWSSTVMMKIDLVGEKQRGFAMGLNEFSGYVSLAVMAFLTGWIAGKYGLRPYPFYTGVVLATLGLLMSWLFVRDTRLHVAHEATSVTRSSLRNIFWETTWKDNNLGSVTQAGFVNNLNDGMVWGLYPILLAAKNFSLAEIGLITGVYPAVWAIGQLFTGRIADRVCKKDMLSWGMLVQALALFSLLFAQNMSHYIIISAFLGVGTAIVYPTFLVTIADSTHPFDRASSLGIFRFWRDLGYAVGAIVTGIIVDWFGINSPIVFVAALTLASSIIIEYRMRCQENPVKSRWLMRHKPKSH